MRALIICPGRGTYNRAALGSLTGLEDAPSLQRFDAYRRALGRQPPSALDRAERFSPRLHLAGENASILTAAISLADLDQLDEARVQPVAVCGNSMGWYTALGYAGALPLDSTARLIETMGQYQADNIIGGQIVYPMVGDDWRADPERVAWVGRAVVETEGLYWSILLGGQAVLGGTVEAIASAPLPPIAGRLTFPLRLPLHSAFHTPLMAETASRAQVDLQDLPFRAPRLPLIDGIGQIWRPRFADPERLREYTLGPQVTRPYDFTTMLRTALREYGPEILILPGPGDNLGGAIAQTLIEEGWQGLRSRDDFLKRQAERPLLVSMRRPEQRALVVRDG